MNDALRITRIVDLMARYREHKIQRSEVIRAVTTRRVVVNGRSLTRLWPLIERGLGERGLYAIRPSGRADYGVLATANPLVGLMSMRDREKNVITRLNNDVEGQVLERLAASSGRSAVSAALQLERARVYLSAFESQKAGMEELMGSAISEYNRLPWASLTTGDIIPWEM